MSFFSTIKGDIEEFFIKNPIGHAIEADAKMAWGELIQIAENDLKIIVEQIGTAVLASLVASDSYSAHDKVATAITAGINAAVAGFKAVGKDVAVQTLTTLATTVVNQINSKVG